MPTLLTDPRSGGVKKKSGVNVLPIIHETWSKVRSDDDETTFLLATYALNSKQDIDLLRCGTDPNPLTAIFSDPNLPQNSPIFGGMRIIQDNDNDNDHDHDNSKVSFASFVYIGEEVGVMAKGRASMHTNGVLNVLEGCSGDWNNVEVWRGMTVEMLGKSKEDCDVNIGDFGQLGKDIAGDVDIDMPEDEWNTNTSEVDDASRSGKNTYEHGHHQMNRDDRFDNENGTHTDIMQKDVEPEHANSQVRGRFRGYGSADIRRGKTSALISERRKIMEKEEEEIHNINSKSDHTDNTINVPTSTSTAKQQGNDDPRNTEGDTDSAGIVADVDGRDCSNNNNANDDDDDDDDEECIPYEQLKNLSLAEFPKVDPSKKEMALSHVEFQDIFHMTKEEFRQLPKWKQTSLKKGVSLF